MHKRLVIVRIASIHGLQRMVKSSFFFIKKKKHILQRFGVYEPIYEQKWIFIREQKSHASYEGYNPFKTSKQQSINCYNPNNK